ncbi:MAG: hypothetical protein MR531_06175 [Lachnospiraceae bacterium]|nr:hypothetical protein [Lachnospiraceae bacterium]
MGLLGSMKERLNRKKVQPKEVEYVPTQEEVSLKRDDVDIHDRKQRERYVRACLEQMAEASKELETLGGEYNLVTSYLTDMEEIEALPPEIKEQLSNMAKQLVELEDNHKKKKERKNIMPEEQYQHMERIAEYMPEGYEKLKKTEEYQVLVKRDLNRLEGEKQAYYFRKNELQNGQKNMKGMTAICVGSMVFLMILLAILGVTFKLDVTMGYLIAVLIAAGALTLVYVKHGDSERELARVNKAINKIVLLQNTVKIRYVNNTNLLEYLYIKYDVDSASDLKKLWAKYEEETKQREEERQLQKDMDFNQAALVRLLRKCKIQDPNIWLHQAVALYDNKEMVEIRHGLIIRRQKLRKQMEYNAKAAQNAQDEVKDLVQKFPEYAKKIIDMVSEYEKALA